MEQKLVPSHPADCQETNINSVLRTQDTLEVVQKTTVTPTEPEPATQSAIPIIGKKTNPLYHLRDQKISLLYQLREKEVK